MLVLRLHGGFKDFATKEASMLLKRKFYSKDMEQSFVPLDEMHILLKAACLRPLAEYSSIDYNTESEKICSNGNILYDASLLVIKRSASVVSAGVLIAQKKDYKKLLEYISSPEIEDALKEHLKDVAEKVSSFSCEIHGNKEILQEIRTRHALETLGNKIRSNLPALRVNLDNPEIKFNIIVNAPPYSSFIYVAFAWQEAAFFEERTCAKRPFSLPISLHPRAARLLINLSGATEDDIVVDPFCGTGGILLEAAVLGLKSIGADYNNEMIEGTKKNLTHFGIKTRSFEDGFPETTDRESNKRRDKLEQTEDTAAKLQKEYEEVYLARWDARSFVSMLIQRGILPSNKQNADGRRIFVVTDPPYGRSSSTMKANIIELYSSFSRELDKFFRLGGAGAAVMVHDPDLIENMPFFNISWIKGWKVHRSLVRFFLVLEPSSPPSMRNRDKTI
ncbi:MAG: DNA methyltransferase [Thermoplasmata archaeon]